MTALNRLTLCLVLLGVYCHGGESLAADYYFYVSNQSGKTIQQLLVTADGSTVGHFDIGQGIRNGKGAKIAWDNSIYGQDCEQFLIARFEEGEPSEPVKIDFCNDMDTPIIFK